MGRKVAYYFWAASFAVTVGVFALTGAIILLKYLFTDAWLVAAVAASGWLFLSASFLYALLDEIKGGSKRWVGAISLGDVAYIALLLVVQAAMIAAWIAFIRSLP